jgi:hypothetical protein
MAEEDECMRGPFELIVPGGRELGLPLAQLAAVDANGDTWTATEDRRYWTAMACEF